MRPALAIALSVFAAFLAVLQAPLPDVLLAAFLTLLCFAGWVAIMNIERPHTSIEPEAESTVAKIVAYWLRVRSDEIRDGRPLSGTPNGIAQEILKALGQPAEQDLPALSLGRGVGEQLEEIASMVEKTYPGTDKTEKDVGLLRDLAKNLGDGGQGEAGVDQEELLAVLARTLKLPPDYLAPIVADALLAANPSSTTRGGTDA